MDEKLKTKWVKALRSGKYNQAKESLKKEIWDENEISFGIGYCCLGVLCEIAPGIRWSDSEGHYVIESKKLIKLFTDEEADLHHIRSDGSVIITGEDLPVPLYKHFGMDKTVKHQKQTKDVHSKLICLNDDGVNFEKIADYIEKVL